MSKPLLFLSWPNKELCLLLPGETNRPEAAIGLELHHHQTWPSNQSPNYFKKISESWTLAYYWLLDSGLAMEESPANIFHANYHVGKEVTCIFRWSYRDWMWVTRRLYIRWWPSHACWWPHTTPYRTQQCGAHHTLCTIHIIHTDDAHQLSDRGADQCNDSGAARPLSALPPFPLALLPSDATR